MKLPWQDLLPILSDIHLIVTLYMLVKTASFQFNLLPYIALASYKKFLSTTCHPLLMQIEHMCWH